MIVDKCAYTDTDEIFNYLDNLDVEYHKQYKRFNKMVKVPRGQASFTLNDTIHYDYKVSGGSPPNTLMCDRLKDITACVNEVLGTNFKPYFLTNTKTARIVSDIIATAKPVGQKARGLRRWPLALSATS